MGPVGRLNLPVTVPGFHNKPEKTILEGRTAARPWAVCHRRGEEGGSGREGILIWPAV